MKTSARRRWSFAWMFAAASLAGCGGSSSTMQPDAGSGACFPACRAGTVCSPAGTCVDACNPPCGAGFTCYGSGAAASCIASGSDAGAPGADAQGTDAATGTDAVSTTDGGTTPGDVPVVMTDAGPDAFVAPTNCGHPGEGCCTGRSCYAGGYCSNMVCYAATRQMGECTSPADCTGGQVCGGSYVCTGGADAGVTDAGAVPSRGCWLCEAAPGATPFGGMCPNASACATGICTDGHCTEACPIGDTGDAQCRARGANYRCFGVYSQPAMGFPITTLGVCSNTCARQGDCTDGSACVPRLNYFADRMDFACAVTTRTGNIGDACNPSATTTCRNVLCVSTNSTGTAGYCTAPCNVDADCPASAPVCAVIYFSRPDGHDQPGHACAPRG